MSAVIIEHVNTSDLPEMWRAKLPVPQAARVTVRIESEAPAVTPVTTKCPARSPRRAAHSPIGPSK